MPQLYSCAGALSDTVVNCVVRGSDGDITSIVTRGSVSSTTSLPIPISDGSIVPIALRWTPLPGATRGQAGVVVSFEGCTDTLWMDVDGIVTMPRISAPDTITATDVVLCSGLPAFVDVPLVSIDSTTWFVSDISAPREVRLDVAVGDSLRGTRVVRATVLPSALGRYSYTVGLQLSPCDTVVNIVITGRAIDARLSHADTIPFVQKIIGRKDQRTALFVNTGDVAIDVLNIEPLAPKPFRLLSTRPAVPCTLIPGDTLTCDVELLQRYGRHLDSLVLVTTNPCQQRNIVVLTSEAYATTSLYMPDITSEVGATEVVPVLLQGRPEIDSSLLDSFRLQIRVLASDLAARNGINSLASWSCREDDTTTTVTITGRWRGGDTIAMIPMQTLLSKSTSTPLMFIETPGFQWIDQPCDVVYRDGSVILGDVCSGRAVRLVSIGQFKPVVITPNPVMTHATVRPDVRLFPGAYSLLVYDELGNTILRAPGTGETVLDLGSLHAGLYVVCVSDHRNQVCSPLIKK